MTDSLEAARNDAFRKLGRNIALFHQLERGLKQFVALRVMQGSTPEDTASFTEKRRKTVAKKSLGQMVGDFHTELSEDAPVCPEPASGLWVQVRMSFDDQYLASRQASLSSLVTERNALVHALNDDYDLMSAEGIARLDALLDPQAERIRAELRHLHGDLKGFDRLRELLGTPEFVEQLLAGSEQDAS